MSNNEIKAYAVKWINDARYDSASGGFFPAVAKYIIDKKRGYVCGCVLNNMRPKHIVSNKWSDIQRMQDSKYVQSCIENCFEEISLLLKKGKWVLFTGTSCQVLGLINYIDTIKINRDRLITMDFFCHGVPSPQIWNDYLKFYEKCTKRKPVGYRFRGKKYGWKTGRHLYTMKYMKGIHTKEDNVSYIASKIWNSIFFSNLCLRPSCYQCRFASCVKPADITMGDFWGIENVLPQFDDDRGCSLCVSRNDAIMQQIKTIDGLLVEEVEINSAINNQNNAFRATALPQNREKFWADYEKMGFSQRLLKKYYSYRIRRRVIALYHRILFELGVRKNI